MSQIVTQLAAQQQHRVWVVDGPKYIVTPNLVMLRLSLGSDIMWIYQSYSYCYFLQVRIKLT